MRAKPPRVVTRGNGLAVAFIVSLDAACAWGAYQAGELGFALLGVVAAIGMVGAYLCRA